jgi:hypothetical protein
MIIDARQRSFFIGHLLLEFDFRVQTASAVQGPLQLVHILQVAW